MQTLEIAVYEATDPDGFAAKQGELHRSLATTFDGYVTSLGLRSATERQVYADLVLWASADAAASAAAALPEREDFAWFATELGPIRFFDHLHPAGDAVVALDAIASAPVVEVVLVKPTEAEPFDAAHSALHAELAVAEVIVGELRLARNDNGVAGDVNGWTTPDAMEEMGPLMMAKPELAPVFDPANEMLLFMPFATNVVA